MANIEIRVKLAETGVKQYEVADSAANCEMNYRQKKKALSCKSSTNSAQKKKPSDLRQQIRRQTKHKHRQTDKAAA